MKVDVHIHGNVEVHLREGMLDTQDIMNMVTTMGPPLLSSLLERTKERPSCKRKSK